MPSERERLEAAYRVRDQQRSEDHWSWLVPEAHWLDFMIQRFLAGAFSRIRAEQPLESCRVLEVGCGDGQVLRWLYDMGLRLLSGSELLDWRAAAARSATPFATVTQADMSKLPYADASFDVAVQVMAFSSCLDAGVRLAAAEEWRRVVRPRGWILSCDFLPDSKPSGHVRGLPLKEIQELFPGCILSARRLGADPAVLGAATSVANQGLLRSALRRVPGFPKASAAGRRPVTRLPLWTAAFLEACPWLHRYLGVVIRKP